MITEKPYYPYFYGNSLTCEEAKLNREALIFFPEFGKFLWSEYKKSDRKYFNIWVKITTFTVRVF